MRTMKTIAMTALLGLALSACAPSAAPPPAGSTGETKAPAASQPAQQPAQQPAAPAAPANPVDAVEIKGPVEIVLWHQQAGPSEALQKTITEEFMKANPNIKVKLENLEDYTKIYQKVLASVQAGSVPEMAATYESMAADYYDAKAIVPFDDYITSKKYGLNEEDLKDFIPSFLEATKFAQFDNKRLTFPYTKSNNVWYANMEGLRSLGFDKPAATWDQVLDHCRKAVAASKQCWAWRPDASDIDAMVFSYGGEVISKDGKKPNFDSPEAMKVLKLFETLYKEKLAYRIQGRDDQNDLASGKALYYMRSSTGIPFLTDMFKDNSKWSASLIPQGSATGPKASVLFGGNISIFKTTPEKQLASWLFVKWFSSKDATARWGSATGYFPVRLSSLQDAGVKKYIEQNPHFASAIEASKFGKVEPSAKGWQEMRPIIQDAVVGIMTGKVTAEEASKQIQEKGTKALNQ